MIKDSSYGTSVHASATIDAVFGVNNAFFVLFTDGVNRAGIITCSAIDAIVINGMGHDFTSL